MGASTSGLLLQGSSGATKGTGLMLAPALFFATAFAAIAAAMVPIFLFNFFTFYLLIFSFNIFHFFHYCGCHRNAVAIASKFLSTD